jgi:hypothetical protein
VVGLVSSSDYCTICEDYGEALLICDGCNDFVCEDCAEEVQDRIFCSEECSLKN